MAETGMQHPSMPDGHYDRLLVRDLELDCSIGVYAHERGRHQRVRINLDLAVEHTEVRHDQIAAVVSYETVVNAVRDVVGQGHVNLVETLAERIATVCLDDLRILSATVRVEKLEAVPDVSAVGVEIVRRRHLDAS